ncbi:MAG: hypothetical protein ACLPWS_16735 [Rhodomicrobium sp.]
MREEEKRCISAATILVVEDETLILMMIADHLRDVHALLARRRLLEEVTDAAADFTSAFTFTDHTLDCAPRLLEIGSFLREPA